MFKINIYLNFQGQSEEAFNFYKSVFGGEFTAFQRFAEVPGMENLSDSDKNKMMHIAFPVGNLVLMTTDALEGMGPKLVVGNNVNVSLHPETEAESYKLFEALSAGGVIETQLEKMFWGGLYGAFIDQYGVRWMLNWDEPKQ